MEKAQPRKLLFWIFLTTFFVACGGESIDDSDKSGEGGSNSASSSSSSSGMPVVAKSGREYYQEFCVACHGDDGKLTLVGDMNVLKHTEDELYSEILLTMPTDDPDKCGQNCAIAVSDYIRDTLYAAELAAKQRLVGVKPTKLLPSDIFINVLKDTFDPIALDTSDIATKLPLPQFSDETGYYSNANALFSGAMLEDLYDAVTPLAEAIVRSDVVTGMCAGGATAVFRAGLNLGFTVPDDGAWHNIELDMSTFPQWQGSMSHLRIDGPSRGGGLFRIDHVRLLNNGGGFTEVVNWNNNEPEEGETSKHVDLSYVNNKVVLNLDPQNNDPLIVFEAFHNVDNADRLLIAIRNQSDNGSTGFQVFFSPAPAGTMAAVSNTECARRFIQRFATKAYRRPLTQAEENRYLELFDSGTSQSNGLVRIAQAIMLSASTLYQVEPEAAGTPQSLSGSELAERLAMFLWGTIPDPELLSVTDSLSDPAVLRQHAERMLNSPKATRQLHKFVKEWLKINRPSPKPDFGLDTDSANAVSNSLARFFDFLMREEDGTLFDLYMDNRAFVTPDVAAIYGVDIPVNAPTYLGGAEVRLPSDRAGIVTRAGFISGLSGTELTNPTRVGNILRERILCQHIPLPTDPDDAVVGDAEGLVGREFVAVHNADPACAGCHAYLDDLGLIFESFDPVGKFRAQYDDGTVIDPSGYYTSLSKKDIEQQGEVADSLAFSQLLSESEVAGECLAKNMMKFALDRPLVDDKSSFDSIMEAFVQSNYRLKDLVLAIVQSDAFTQQGTEQ